MVQEGLPPLTRLLREADEDGILRLLEAHEVELAFPALRQALRNPYAGRRVVDWLLARPARCASYQVRAELAAHPATPEAQALRLVPGLYWRDLVRLGRDPRVPPLIRRAADRRLENRLEVLTLGERVSIARSAGPGVIARLRHDPHPRVVRALLENPRLTEGLLLPLIGGDGARPEILRVIAEDGRWSHRCAVRAALCRNPRTPVMSALRLLPLLSRPELREVIGRSGVPAAVRRRARLLAGESGGGI